MKLPSIIRRLGGRLPQSRRARMMAGLGGLLAIPLAVVAVVAASVWIEDRFPADDSERALLPGVQRVVTKPIVAFLSHQAERHVRARADMLFMSTGMSLEETVARFLDESVDLKDRRIHAYRLARVGSPECIAALLQVLHSAPPEHKALIAQLVGSTGNPAAKAITPSVPPRAYDIDVAQDGSGKVMALGTIDGIEESGGDPELGGSVGAVKTVNGEPTAVVKGSFNGTRDGEAATASASGSGPLEIVDIGGGVDGVMGTGSYKAKVAGVPFSGKNVPVLLETPPGAGDNLRQDWSLQLDLVARLVKNKERIFASAILVLPNGDTIQFPEKAVKFNAATGYKRTFKKGTNTTANPDVIDPKTTILLSGLKFVKVGNEWEPDAGTITYQFLGQKGVENLMEFVAP